MGSWFSSPDVFHPVLDPYEFAAAMEHAKRLAAIPGPRTREEIDAHYTCMFANQALHHYNSTHQGAKFQSLDQPAADTKSSCVGFRKDLWYHIGFSASRKDDSARRFFAELRFDPCSDTTTVETCTILEPLCRFRSSCAFCPEESKIFHPNDAHFRCGKEGHENEFFRERCAWDDKRCAWDGHGKVFFSQSDMLAIPFSLGGAFPRYRLMDQP